MLISRTPLRISFVGGGSDLPSYYRYSPGAVISTTIDKYVYVIVKRSFDKRIKFAFENVEVVQRVHDLTHIYTQKALQLAKIKNSIEVLSFADIPPGTGLGSSSAYSVGLLNILHEYAGKPLSKDRLAELACELEIKMLKQPIGKQDQYSSAFGGLNFIEFDPDDSVTVKPITLSKRKAQELQKNCLFFFTGYTRSASNILRHQTKNMRAKATRVTQDKMVKLAHAMNADLQKGNITSFGQLLHENWMLKKELASGIANDEINEWYTVARKHGAEGGKICGAGGGGFMLLYAPYEKHSEITRALTKLRPVPVAFTKEGSTILYEESNYS